MNYAKKVADAIDKIDSTEFGKLGKLFDQLAVDAQKAVSECDSLIATLQEIILADCCTARSLKIIATTALNQLES